MNHQRNGCFNLGVLASLSKENQPGLEALHVITLLGNANPGSMTEGQGGKSRESKEEV